MKPALLALLVALSAGAEDGGDPGVIPLTLEVGKTYSVCESGLVPCPAGGPICDDPKVATYAEDSTRGMLWKGVGSGTTLCSVAHINGAGRRVWRITVR